MGEITEMVQIPISFLDEVRYHIVPALPRCPYCGCGSPKLFQLPSGCFVACSHSKCDHVTPTTKHADQAVKHWIMVARLSQ